MENRVEVEICQRCGVRYPLWMTPSPLWNYVMGPNEKNQMQAYGGFVCMHCFILLAGNEGSNLPCDGWVISVDFKRSVAWRLELKPEPKGLIFETPTGRIWDRTEWRWVRGQGEREVLI